jgi:hypothetical protein
MSAEPTPFPMPLCAKYLGTTAPSKFDAFKKIYEHFTWQKTSPTSHVVGSQGFKPMLIIMLSSNALIANMKVS